jgi:hypothetical protein
MITVPLGLVPLVSLLVLVFGGVHRAGAQGLGQAAPTPSSNRGAAPKAYLQAGFVASSHPAGLPNHRVWPAISGTTVGLAAAGGVFVTKTLAVEGEVVAGRPVSTQQRFSYSWFEDYTGESRDVFLGANMRWRPATRSLELVGGAGLAFSTVANRNIVVTDVYPGERTSTKPDQVETTRHLTLNGGIALPLSVSRRVEVVPAFTVRWLKQTSDYYGLRAYAGVGSLSYHVGATVRLTAR